MSPDDPSENSELESCPKPTAEERLSQYQRRDLRLKRIALGLSAVTILGLGITLWLNSLALNSNAASLRSSNGDKVVSMVLSMGQVFIEYPNLRPYFYDGVMPSDPSDARLQAVADLVLDVLDVAKSQSREFRDQWDTPDAWDTWTIDMFRTSPYLCQELRDHANWYGPRLYDMMLKGEQLRATAIPKELKIPAQQ